MKFSTISKTMILSLALLLATSAFAGDTHKGSVQFFNDVQLNGKQLPAGEYQVKWEGTGSNVEMSILRNNKVLATAPAQLVDLAQKPNNNAALINNNADGSRSVSQIRFAGKKYALEVGRESAQNQMKSSEASK
ncbi:MAG TPA: hypothetical protein VMT53_24235 [Terriglobales bacterium]|nr:hypothetical protein [Terriglobales bacterium]